MRIVGQPAITTPCKSVVIICRRGYNGLKMACFFPPSASWLFRVIALRGYFNKSRDLDGAFFNSNT